MIYAFRRTGILGWFIAVWNGLMLLTIPFCGGHYLVDMFAGAAVMAVTTFGARTALRIGERHGDAPSMFSAPAGTHATEISA